MLQQISEAETEIMEIIWAAECPITSTYLSDKLKTKKWKPTTLLTFLSRLCEKGLLEVQKQGKGNQWSAIITRDEYLQHETTTFLNQLHGGSIRSFLASLTGENSLDKQDLVELREWFSKQIDE